MKPTDIRRDKPFAYLHSRKPKSDVPPYRLSG